MADAPSAATIAARLDRLPSSWAVWRLVLLISLGGCFEFYDLMMTAYIAPGLVKAGVFHVGAKGLLGLSDQAMFAAATFAGLFLGTMVFSQVADRFGRRAIFTASLIWYTAATLVMAGQSSAAHLDLWRFISGIGIGVELVTIDAYVTEITPPALRGRAFALNQAIQFLAVPIVAFACWRLIPLTPFGVAGWRWVMILGALAAAVVWVIRIGLPESPRWLAQHGRLAEADAVVARLEQRIEARTGRPLPAPAPAADAAPEPQGRFLEIFQPPYLGRTIMLSVFNAAQTIGFYGFGNWVPTLLAGQGQAVTKSLQYAFIIAFAYPAGPLLCSLFADRFERKHLIVAAALATAGLGLTFAGQSAPVVLIALGVGITLSNNLLSFAYHAYQAELFPTRIRARAVGFVYSWSRLSTVFSSLIIAALLGAFGNVGVFSFIAAAMGVVVVAIGAFGPRTGGRSLEAVSH
ncbi:MFS transporter [Caulobacter sp. KR2-114]|uniref:MFS transporter n=1 Tax=Caulobacter sp. KR2-114 TaxID=3400912 RepID=UPI003C007EFC